MSTLKISLAPNPAGRTGWFGRAMAGLGVLAIIAAGIAISPAATNAGHEWTRSMQRAAAPVNAAVAERPRADVRRPDRFDAPTERHPDRATERRGRREIRRVVHPVPVVDQGPEPVRIDPVAVDDPTRRDAFARRVVARLIEGAKSGFERLTRGVVVTSAAR